jgi:AcrR family transcriptional regulator
MSASTAVPTRRERRRTETVQEILDAAERQLAEVGVQALSLRAVAREIGMTVQSLYHYFASRDDLITALVAQAHDDLADAVENARTAQRDADRRTRLLAVARAYRDWAVANPVRFGVAYGMPMADYAAPVDGPTTVGPRRMAAVFADVVFDGWTRRELERVELPDAPPALLPALDDAPGATGELPPAAAALFLVAWGRMHGMVSLEAFGHTAWLGAAGADLFDAAMRLLVDDMERLRTGA